MTARHGYSRSSTKHLVTTGSTTAVLASMIWRPSAMAKSMPARPPAPKIQSCIHTSSVHFLDRSWIPGSKRLLNAQSCFAWTRRKYKTLDAETPSCLWRGEEAKKNQEAWYILKFSQIPPKAHISLGRPTRSRCGLVFALDSEFFDFATFIFCVLE